MRNLIPHFISEKYSRNECEGSFKASILFLDISGFTAMTESLMCEGKESEEINRAVLSCEIWQINKSEEHRTVALELFKKLYEGSENFDYKAIIDELEK